jgi:hypothetical protein
MTSDFSAARRRQTLGDVLNNVPASQIPQPASVMKKSVPGHASVATGGLAPPRSILQPQRFGRGSTAGDAPKMSVSQIGSQRDSLRNSRQSYAPQNSIRYVLSLRIRLSK